MLPVQQTSVDGVPAKTADDSVISHPKDGLICMQWYQPLLDKLTASHDDTELCIIMMYALACKSGKQLSGSRWIDVVELQQIATR